MKTNSLIETKVGGGSFTYLTVGYAVWAILANIPWVQANLSLSLQQQMPFLVAWLLGTLVAYRLPHTHRPDLAPPGGWRLPIGGFVVTGGGGGTSSSDVSTGGPGGGGSGVAGGGETADAGQPKPRIEEVE